MSHAKRAAFGGAFVLTMLTFAAAPLAAQQRVPMRNNIPVAPQGICQIPLPDSPVRYETAEGQNIEVSVVTRGLAHAVESCVRRARHDPRHGARRRGARHPRRQARGRARRRRARGAAARSRGLDGHRAASELRDERFRLSFLQQADQCRRHRRGHRARSLGWASATRYARRVRRRRRDDGWRSPRVRRRRHVVRVRRRWRRRSSAESEQPRRQSVAPDARRRCARRQSVRRPRRLQARDLHARPSQRARARGASRRRARFGSSRWGRTAATSSTCSSPAATTVGRS